MSRVRSRIAALLLLAGCARADVVARGPCRTDDDCLSRRCESGACLPGFDANVDGGGFCDGSGPLYLVGDSPSGSACGGDVARTTFRHAICACTQLAFSSTLVTDAFDSTMGPYTQSGGGAAVGTNGALATNAPMSIGGSLLVASNVALDASAGLSVRGQLGAGGTLVGPTSVQVLGDARIAGDVTLAALQVGGTLVVPASRVIAVSPGPLSTKATVRAEVAAPVPCDCGGPLRLDVGAAVSARADDNDNAAIGLSASALAAVSGDVALDLPCGRYYLQGIGTTAPATVSIRALGRVALFVDGDVDVTGAWSVELASGAELDLLVAGSIRTMGGFAFGDPAHPARTRLYVGGTGSIALDQAASFAGNLYAPTATVQTAGPFEGFGAIFADSVQASDAFTLHYDRAVLGFGDECPLPTGCGSCRDCGNQACNGGTCGACSSSADCCSPLECLGGICMLGIE